MKKYTILLTLVFAIFLSGCTLPYSAAVDERPIKTQYRDTVAALEIKKEILEDDSLSILDFDVYSFLGRAYIIGEYENVSSVRKVQEIAANTQGIKYVHTYMLPQKETTCGFSDNVELAARIKKELIEDKQIWSTNITVNMVQCHVVLLGVVGSEKEITLAIQHARKFVDADKVKSFLQVAPRYN
ncbi:MAG: BON domain-containing protein [Desulfovibrio sp.]